MTYDSVTPFEMYVVIAFVYVMPLVLVVWASVRLVRWWRGART